MARAKSTPDKLLGEWFWTDRWMGSSGFLLPMEPRGLYREMLTQAWRRGAQLPNDHETIQRAVGCTLAEWKRCWPKVARHWRVEGDVLVNDTQLEIYAACQVEKEKASNRGKKGAQARAQLRAQVAAQARTQAPTQVGAQATTQVTPEHMLEMHPPDPDPGRSKDQERSTRAGGRAFTGVRLKVSQGQQQVVLDALGAAAASLDLPSLYLRWDAELVASGEPFDVLVYLKRRVAELAEARRAVAAGRQPSDEWFEECKRLHSGTCEGQMRHHTQMIVDEGKTSVTVPASDTRRRA